MKAAREAQGLSLDKIAEQLHLTIPIIQALENNDFKHLPQAVFVKGYVRNYARYLGLDTEVMMAAFVAACPDEDGKRPLKHSYNVQQQVNSGHGMVKAVTWFVVLGFIALMLLFWYDEIVQQFNPQTTDVSNGSSIENEALGFNLQPDDSGHETPTGDDGQAPTEMASENRSSAVPADNFSPLQAENTTASEAGISEAVVETSRTESVAPQQEPLASTATTAVALRFSKNSWIRVRDSAGSFRRTGLQKEGEVLTLGGKPPWQLKLGNAAAVSIEVNGRIDTGWQQHIDHRGVAEFTLNP
ncbi:MAG: DUF4115 domain-containing protein [gamma proteobacterium symbiont of Bathyaustriella thionipta]|nr:DUF4115 domain-containing protein [gamma proteobacterium symbiont of Bathyaustriella thionipta]